MVLKKTKVSYKSVSQLLTNVQEGNLTTTTLALICLNEVLTPDVKCIQALIDRKAVKLFLNILEAKFVCVRRSQFAALRCLTKLCDSKVLQKEVLSLNGVQLLFHCLSSSDFELMFTAIHLISNISSDSSSWEPANECGGVYQLISLLDTSQKKLIFATQVSKNDIIQLKLSVAEFAAKSLSLLCQHEANRKVACLSNIISVCHYWIRSKHQNVIIPILVLLQQLCIQLNFRRQVNESHVIVDVFNHLQSANMELKQVAADLILIVKAYIAGTIGMCLKSQPLREVIKKSGAIEIMVQYLRSTHIPLIINLNEALSKGSSDPDILKNFFHGDSCL